MIDTETFIELYYAIRKEITKQYIGLPKYGSKTYELIERAVETINNIKADPFHFLGFVIKYYSAARVFPTPRHLTSTRVLDKYKYHQGLKNVYCYQDYSINGDDVLIHATNEVVSLAKDINTSFDQDIRIRYLVFVDSIGKANDITGLDINELRKYVYYAKVKFNHKGRSIPNHILMLEEAIHNANHCQSV